MLKKINYILNIVIGSAIGTFIGNGIYVFWDYRAHSGLYAMRSAPWYAGILVYGMVTIAVLAAAILAKLVIRRRLKQ